MIFTNGGGSFIQVPVEEKTISLFVHHFERLSPGFKRVEESPTEDKESK